MIFGFEFDLIVVHIVMLIIDTYFLHSSSQCAPVYIHTDRRYSCHHSGTEGCSGTHPSPPHNAHLQGHIPLMAHLCPLREIQLKKCSS